MAVDIQDCFEPLTHGQVAAFERDLGVVLPEQYRRFLLSHNGGFFADEIQYRDPSTGMVHASVKCFYGIDTDDHTCDLRVRIGWYQGSILARTGERIPTELIPIAEGPGGEFCIGVLGDARGMVFWWDQEEDMESPWDNTSEFADTFDAFRTGMEVASRCEPLEETTPLFQAVETGDADTIREFLARGGSVEERSDRGCPLLVCGASYNRVAIVRMLLELGANVESRDADGRTALYWTDSNDIVKLLLQRGADPNATDNRGRTPLIHAVEMGNVRKVRQLLRHGAEVNLRSADGRSPLSLCQASPHDAIRPLLLSAGAVK